MISSKYKPPLTFFEVFGYTKAARNDSRDHNNNTITKNKNKTPVNDSTWTERGNEYKNEIKERKNVIIVGDSLLNGLQENGLRKNHNVKMYAPSGATTEDIIGYVNPIIRKKPDCLILHCGTNDITNDVDTINNIERIISNVKKKCPDTKLTISKLIIRKDRNNIDNELKN